MSVAGMAAGDKEGMLEKAELIAEDCKTVSDPDRCEQAIKIGKCMEEGARTHKLTMEPDEKDKKDKKDE